MNKLESVYIIDDDGVDILVAHANITKLMPSVQVLTFSSALAALKQIEAILVEGKTLPELILLDINMPSVDGWQFLDSFRMLTAESMQKSIIYLLSSSTHFLDHQKVKTYQIVEELIAKPITTELLQQIKHKHFLSS